MAICDVELEGPSITFKFGDIFCINENMHSKSKSLIYCATCQTCKKNITEQNGDQLIDRLRVHKQKIRDSSVRNTP